MSDPISISNPPTPAQVAKVIAAGPGATVHHHLVAYPGRRRELEAALGRAGVPHRLVRTLGWSPSGPKVEAVSEAPAAVAHVAEESPQSEDSPRGRKRRGSD